MKLSNCTENLFVLSMMSLPLIASPIALNQVVLCSNANTNCQSLIQQAAPIDTVIQYPSSTNNQIAITAFASEDLITGSIKASNTFSNLSATSLYTQINVGAQITSTFQIAGTGVGFVAPVFDITGATSRSGLGSIYSFLNDGSGVQIGTAPNSGFFSGSSRIVFSPLPIHFGTAVSLTYGLAAVTFPAGTLTGYADYSHTAVFTGLEVFDSQRNPIYNIPVTTDGLNINVLAPEPTALMLAGSGLVALLWRRGIINKPLIRYRPRKCAGSRT